ncbi:hypothetical protein [Pseudoxanthomonas japonensis]|uniref:hypothetical protein n=1 Tax=Pseudoxanthomonas japonensis TaxID=69284 RepID=UPI001BCC9987|nr:hypothetical protein [Pseudoxanthomonas japonensis]
MTTILLDTNAYLRLAKRIRPLLGVKFNPRMQYQLIVLPEVEGEVLQNPRLKSHYPWFMEDDHRNERRSARVKLSADDKDQIEKDTAFMKRLLGRNAAAYIQGGRSPPGPADRHVLAVALLRGWCVATDDEGMHVLAKDLDIKIFYCFEVLHKMLSAEMVDKDLVIDIYDALERNNDLTVRWKEARTKLFKKVFPSPKKTVAK